MPPLYPLVQHVSCDAPKTDRVCDWSVLYYEPANCEKTPLSSLYIIICVAIPHTISLSEIRSGGNFLPPLQTEIHFSRRLHFRSSILIAKMKHWIIAVIFRHRNPQSVDWSMRNRMAILKIIKRVSSLSTMKVLNPL